MLTSTGSEATFHALRLARAVTGRRLLVKFQGCYHGWHDSVAMNVISRPDRVGQNDPLSKGVLPEVTDATLVLPFNDVEAVRGRPRSIRREIAAIILEPIPHNVGALLPKPGFLEGRRAGCATRTGSVLIFDEVITGFPPLRLGGYQRLSGVTPDLTTLGKAMANGYPIGALGGRRELMDSSPPRRAAGVLRRHLQRAPGHRRRRARDDTQAPAASPCTSTSSRSASGSRGRARRGSRSIGVPR